MDTNTTQIISYKSRVSRKDYLAAAIIGEAIAWLVVFTARGAEIPLPFGKITTVLLPLFFPILSVVGLAMAFLLSRFLPPLVQIAKFVLVGALNTFIDLGILNLLIIAMQRTAGVAYLAFKGTSFVVAVINSYFWNKHWTFQAAAQTQERGKEFGEFLLVSIVGLLINIGVAGFLNDFVGPQAGIGERPWATISAIAATFVSLAWNFLGYKFVVFKKQNEALGAGL